MNVYLDNNATTYMIPQAREALVNPDYYGNASSMHEAGRRAAEALESARTQIAALVGATPAELIFTFGATESNNTVFSQFASLCIKSGERIIVSAVEHPSIIEAAKHYKSLGCQIDYARVDSEGILDIDALRSLIAKPGKVALISLMTANNETGALQPVREVAELAHNCGALFHTDATQAVGKIPVNLGALGADYASFSAHKFCGPKGVGVLYVRSGAPFETFMLGGHQETGKRAGTYNTPAIVATGIAAESAAKKLENEAEREWALRERLRLGIENNISNIRINSPLDKAKCLPGTLNVSFLSAEGESVLLYLDLEGICVSTGSACATGSLEPSYVLLAQGLELEAAHCSIRFSLGHETTESDIDYTITTLTKVIKKLRGMSTR